MYNNTVTSIILAAGKGTRMGSKRPKVLRKVGGQPILLHSLNKFKQLQLGNIFVVVGEKNESIKKSVGKNWNYIEGVKPLGTGFAVKIALKQIPKKYKTIMVVNGDDSAFYKLPTLKNILNSHFKSKKKMTILTVIKRKVDISGRVVRDDNGHILSIKANREFASEDLGQNNELVCGIYLFDRVWLEQYLPKVKVDGKGEYPITALITVAIAQKTLNDIMLSNPLEWQSINTQRELRKARKLWRI